MVLFIDVIEAILDRHSVRDFSPKPVLQEIVMKILEAATRSPSGGNGQPWEVFMEWGSQFFGAPVLVVICLDKALSSNLDIGIFAAMFGK
jgi:hypothetical protein